MGPRSGDSNTPITRRVRLRAKEEMSSGNAVHLWYCKDITVKDNVVKHHRDGIYLEFVDNSQVSGNISAQNLRYGLHFMFSNDDEYSNDNERKTSFNHDDTSNEDDDTTAVACSTTCFNDTGEEEEVGLYPIITVGKDGWAMLI